MPRAWRSTAKARQRRPRPGADAPAQIPDSKVGQLDALLHQSGALELIAAELRGRPGPSGLPVRTVLVALLLTLHYHGSATLADACRVLLDELRAPAREWLGVVETDRHEVHARLAFCQRAYRSFDRLTTALDPHRCDRRRRLPLDDAAEAAAAWEDDQAEHLRRRKVLQEINDRLVLVTVRLAHRHGFLKGWHGDVGIDTTAVPSGQRPPKYSRDLASVEITAGKHFSAGDETGIFGYSATLTVAAARRHPAGHPQAGRRSSAHPQLVLGLVLDTPGKRIGPNAVHTLRALKPLGLPTGLLAADRAYTDQTTEHFALPTRRLGYQLVLDYKRNQRGVQGSHLGALLVDGSLACPLMPAGLANTTHGLEDKTVREFPEDLAQQIAAREPYYLKLKEGPDARGAIRLQCPAAGPSPSVTCPRFSRTHQAPAPPPTTVDLTNPRATAAHPAAKPTIQVSKAERLRPPPGRELPEICQQPTWTIRPGDIDVWDKFRQDRHYLTPAWLDAYKPIRAHNEGINGRAKGHRVDIAEPKKRLARGRVAQTILVALMISIINLQILTDWQRTIGDHTPLVSHHAECREDTNRPRGRQQVPTEARPPPAGLTRRRSNH
ncbi:hypothetical protein GCM10027091_77510 [Streptomyces daliensis]